MNEYDDGIFLCMHVWDDKKSPSVERDETRQNEFDEGLCPGKEATESQGERTATCSALQFLTPFLIFQRRFVLSSTGMIVRRRPYCSNRFNQQEARATKGRPTVAPFGSTLSLIWTRQ